MRPRSLLILCNLLPGPSSAHIHVKIRSQALQPTLLARSVHAVQPSESKANEGVRERAACPSACNCLVCMRSHFPLADSFSGLEIAWFNRNPH